MEYMVKLTPDELVVISEALNELPRKLSQPLFMKIQAQITAQDEENKKKESEGNTHKKEKKNAKHHPSSNPPSNVSALNGKGS